MKNQNEYLKHLGIENWQLKNSHNQKNPKTHAANFVQSDFVQSDPENSHAVSIININNINNLTEIQPINLETLKNRVSGCILCPLCKTRTQTVFGEGPENARLMFIGEGPGAEEDRQGKPFVGRAGQLLTQMLKAIELKREEVFIANIVKCRPPKNRDPLPLEVDACTPYLRQQINLIKPKLLIALGRISAHFLLNTQTPLGKLRNQVFNYHHIPLIVTYHPAYLLRAPHDKVKAFEDLQQIYTYI